MTNSNAHQVALTAVVEFVDGAELNAAEKLIAIDVLDYLRANENADFVDLINDVSADVDHHRACFMRSDAFALWSELEELDAPGLADAECLALEEVPVTQPAGIRDLMCLTNVKYLQSIVDSTAADIHTAYEDAYREQPRG